MIEIQSPVRYTGPVPATKVFLAGSIEMGSAEEWQARVIEELNGYEVTVFNPRRDDWDSSWEQSINDANFNEQVTWELDALECSDHVVVYFDPATKAPITLLEVGLHARDDKLIICCPDGYWRKGNIEIICRRFNIPLLQTFEEMMTTLKSKLNYAAA
jgi:hypothetical protein